MTDLASLRNSLSVAGLLVDVVVRKHRRSFAYDEFTLEVDTLPHFGTFLDVELLGVASELALPRIYGMLERLGFSHSDVVTTTYTDLVRQMA